MAEERISSEEIESDESEGSQSSYSSSDNEDEEPVLKYKRFAKEVVQSTCDGSEGARDVINCITVHPKVFSDNGPVYTNIFRTFSSLLWGHSRVM
jgi:hypothetical protein